MNQRLSILVRRLRIRLSAVVQSRFVGTQQRSRQRLGYLPAGMVALTLTCTICATLELLPVREQFDNLALAAGFWMRGAEAAPADVAIVSLDDKSKAKLQLPAFRAWPRDKVAHLVSNLHTAGAKRIILDVLITTPGFSQAEDDALEAALRESHAIIGTDRDLVRNPPGSPDFIVGSDPIKPMADAAGGVFSTIVWTARSRDGAVRFISEVTGADQFRIPLMMLFERSSDLWQHPPGVSDRIHFYGPPGTIPLISGFDAFENRELRERVAGKVVFVGIADPDGIVPTAIIGETARALPDQFVVPISSRSMFGVEIHATIYANLRDRKWIDGSWYPPVTASLLIAAAFNLLICFASGVLRSVFLFASPLLWCGSFCLALAYDVFLPGAVQAIVGVPLCGLLVMWVDHLRMRRWMHSVENALIGASRH